MTNYFIDGNTDISILEKLLQHDSYLSNVLVISHNDVPLFRELFSDELSVYTDDQVVEIIQKIPEKDYSTYSINSYVKEIKTIISNYNTRAFCSHSKARFFRLSFFDYLALS